MNKSIKISIYCGCISMIVGSAIFLFWLGMTSLFWQPPDLKWLIISGVAWTYAGGPILVFIGLCFLLVGTYRLKKDRSQSGSRRASWKSLFVLLSNFLIAGFYLWIFISLTTLYSVRVINISTNPVENVKIYGGGVEKVIDRILPGEKETVHLRFLRDGTLRCQFQYNGTVKKKIIEGYVTNNGGGRKTIEIRDDGELFILSTISI